MPQNATLATQPWSDSTTQSTSIASACRAGTMTALTSSVLPATTAVSHARTPPSVWPAVPHPLGTLLRVCVLVWEGTTTMVLATFVLSATTPVTLAPIVVSVHRVRLQPTRDSSTTQTIFASARIGSTMMGPTSSACRAFTPAWLVRLPPALAFPATPLLIGNYSVTTVTVCHASTMI